MSIQEKIYVLQIEIYYGCVSTQAEIEEALVKPKVPLVAMCNSVQPVILHIDIAAQSHEQCHRCMCVCVCVQYLVVDPHACVHIVLPRE